MSNNAAARNRSAALSTRSPRPLTAEQVAELHRLAKRSQPVEPLKGVPASGYGEVEATAPTVSMPKPTRKLPPVSLNATPALVETVHGVGAAPLPVEDTEDPPRTRAAQIAEEPSEPPEVVQLEPMDKPAASVEPEHLESAEVVHANISGAGGTLQLTLPQLSPGEEVVLTIHMRVGEQAWSGRQSP